MLLHAFPTWQLILWQLVSSGNIHSPGYSWHKLYTPPSCMAGKDRQQSLGDPHCGLLWLARLPGSRMRKRRRLCHGHTASQLQRSCSPPYVSSIKSPSGSTDYRAWVWFAGHSRSSRFACSRLPTRSDESQGDQAHLSRTMTPAIQCWHGDPGRGFVACHWHQRQSTG